MTYENVLVNYEENVGILTLNRPTALNALNSSLIKEIGIVLKKFEQDEKVRSIIITGGEKAFAAGADIKEMQSKSFIDVYIEDFITRDWEQINNCRKPIVAAVAGYALGGGCELAMMCDFIIAADNAKFGQPEIQIGIIPGSGGTQRLARFIGKSKTMEMVLTGRLMDAKEAEKSGLVSRVVPAEELLKDTIKTAKEIACKSLPSVLMAKESVNRAFETSLQEGIKFERRLFHSAFALDDQKEGMAAFIEKRKPSFKHQ